MPGPIFQHWRESDSARWGKEVVVAQHSLAASPLFDLDALASLIDAYPRDACDLVEAGEAGTPSSVWRQGDLGDLSGRDILRSIESSRVWLNLRRVQDVDSRYAELLAKIFEEIEANIPGLRATRRTMGILVSSPGIAVPYHLDLPAQSLFQVRGVKRFILYPAAAPYIDRADLETIALYGGEVNLTYDDAYESNAQVIDLTPGAMVHWPLHAPHRVENLDMLNVSVTIEHWTQDVRRIQMVNAANGILRHHFAVTPTSSSTQGLGFLAKAVLQAGWRRSPWSGHRKRRPDPAFRLAKVDSPARSGSQRVPR